MGGKPHHFPLYSIFYPPYPSKKFGGIIFSERKQPFKPDNLDQLKAKEGGVH